MSAIVKYEDQGLGEIMTLGDVFKQSGYFRDVRDQAQAVVKILYGRELGFSPVVSMMGIHVIEGKPALSANLMGAMVKRSGRYNYRVKTLTDKACELEFTEQGSIIGSSAFSLEDAQRAGVVRDGSGWKKYPRNMLFARALSNGVKLFCPELSACPVYVPEELGAEVNEEGAVIDLPKTAKPVAVTTEAKTYTKKPTIAISEPVPVVQSVPQDEPAEAVEVVPVAGADCISAGEAANFHRMFKDALPAGMRKDSAEMAHEWLRNQGILDVLGKPSALAIKKANFYDVRNAAIEFAGAFRV